MSTVQKMIGIAGFVFVLGLGVEGASADCPEYPEGFTCECNAAFTEWVCAKWAQGGTPTHGADFEVTYVSGVPDVTLATADPGWELYSEVISSSAPADIGTLTLDDDGADDYEVTIANGAGAGAANVGTISLTDAGFTGYSSIEGGSISGNLIGGGLTLVQDSSGNGGELTLTIGGSVFGAMTIPVLKDLMIGNNLYADLDVTVKVDGAGLEVVNDVYWFVEVHLADIVSGAIGFNTNLDGFFGGDLILDNGVPDDISVWILGNIPGSSTIDLNDADLAGLLAFQQHSHADIVNGGALTGTFMLGHGGHTFYGSAQFASVASTGRVRVSGDLYGTLSIDADCDGDIVITRDLLGGIIIGSDLTGDVTISRDISSSGSVTVGGALAAAALAGAGRILVTGMCDGDIDIAEQTDTLTLIHLLGGLDTNGGIEINTSGGTFDAEGNINVGPATPPVPLNDITFDGFIRIYSDEHAPPGGGDLKGTITIIGCHNPGDLFICLDGGDGYENIYIKQGGCTNQVDWSCPS